ncbi:MAG: putative DNA binding domain-containing protein [Lachnospiraceae bacterium]|nr:putative DNA binding domain-containing protein [Lachnospiraceae bacterium]
MRESEKIEFKEIFIDEIKKEAVAFANSQGGVIYVGIRDDGEVIGIDNSDEIMQKAANMLRDAIHPDITMFVHYRIENMEGKEVLAIEIQSGTDKPYYIYKNGLKPSGVYIRQGSSSVPASESAIRQMIKDTDGDVFEQMRSLDQELTFLETEQRFLEKEIDFGGSQRQTLELISLDGQYTNLGLLLSDQCPFTVKCAVFSGKDQSAFQDRKEFSGSLLKQLDEVYAFIDQHNNLSASFSGLYRNDTRDYPESAIREALLNSFVHRDYSYSASILISIYEDRIEFVSIGGLIDGIGLDDVLAGLSICRNRQLADIFYRLDLIEAYGTGLPKIVNAYLGSSVRPEFLTTQNTFKTILPNRNKKKQADVLKERTFLDHIQMSRKQESPEQRIADYLAEHGSIKRSEVEKLLGVSQATSGRLLKRMMEDGKLYRSGNGKMARYELM